MSQVVSAADVRTHSFIVKIDIPADREPDHRACTARPSSAWASVMPSWCPRSAIVEMAGLTGVYIVSAEGNAVFQMVQLGDVQGDSIEAVTGLKAGDRVVVSRHDARIDGRKVVLPEARNSADVQEERGCMHDVIPMNSGMQ